MPGCHVSGNNWLPVGFATGPGKSAQSWEKASIKFLQRANLWGMQRLGLQYAARTYNTFAMSVMTYVAQLEKPSAAALDAEVRALRRAAKGPGNWARPQDLWYLSQCYGQSVSFQSLAVTARASQVRVAVWEPLQSNGLYLRGRARALNKTLAETDYIDRLSVWQDWYSRSHIKLLVSSLDAFERLGVDSEQLKEQLSRGAPKPWDPRVVKTIKRTFQRTVATRILDKEMPDAEIRVREKLTRWKLEGPPAHTARRVLRRLRELHALVAPRVAAACLSTLWNRWATARRFQRRESAENRCVLGCAGFAEDSVEHYSHCSAVRRVAGRFLRLPRSDTFGIQEFLLADRDPVDIEELVCRAILMYATFMATNYYRKHGIPASEVAKNN